MNTVASLNPKVPFFWTIWIALVLAIVGYQFQLGGGMLSGKNAGSSIDPWIMTLGIGNIVAASIVRWILMPRMRELGPLLVCMIIGLALSEATEFYGIFLISHDYPETKMTFFTLSFLSALQFVPIYAKQKPSALIS